MIVNGRKVTRQLLNDGDIVTIGEIQFRYVAQNRAQPALKGVDFRPFEATFALLAPRIRYLSRPSSALSSAVEHHLDMVGVSGSIPLARTNLTN